VTRPPAWPTVAFADPEPNGLADLIGRLLEANLAAHPGRRRLLGSAVIELVATDAEVVATVRIDPEGATVANGRAEPDAHVFVRGRGQDLIDLATVPLRGGLPDLLDRSGRSVVRRILAGDVRVSGMLRHPVRTSRFLRLLSVAR
jgi:hypothetical protein